MSQLSPTDVAARLGSGLLSFPVTHLTEELTIDEKAYREHIGWLSEYPAAGLFAAGGTGEFFSLTPAEVEQAVRSAVDEAPEEIPVIAPAGYGTATAVELAQSAERAGAAGILLLPPYLTEASQDGLYAHVKAVCDATDLGVIIYNRANAVYDEHTVARLADACPNLVGFKDGVGNVEQMVRIYSALGDRLLYVGGLPTAELFALPYLSLGLTTYSSAIFNFLPGFAIDFYDAVRRGDQAHVVAALNDFVIPYCDLRNRKAGYAVSIIKAGLKVVGRPAGPVRSPLTDLTAGELDELAALVKKVS
ncbi:5-dehydro-4-deoxyglucarate dehydratase [Mumia zhuanghuii]|uniref:Probable 5-dehydro-4-deoxyglucarate dehydratase n=2 Tax=Mumia TaxID=1546255 RepID=A0ABW1QL31_9ACTN|nr:MULTISPECIES: 5-dehydro-4-deoxyglucarate dehydratase [Mumia]KAA1418269.1 5-dehydro-4-deoxyglucarate dehydratase [Mumia zhuanghuii]